MKPLVLAAGLLLCAFAVEATPVSFHRGVNLTGWFQSADLHQTPAGRFGPRDFAQLKALGVDVVRLPVNFAAMVGPGPGYQIDPLAYVLLDGAMDELEAAGLKVVLDNHSDLGDPVFRSGLGGFLSSLWGQLAGHFRNRSSLLLYEIQNEPRDIAPADWDRIQRGVLAEVRRYDPNRTVVVTGADWGGVDGLAKLPVYDDKNLIYSFHFYDPMVFTHQGADWTDLTGLKGVHFPPRGALPGPGAKVASWWVDQLRAYYQSDAAALMAASLDRAAAFARDRGVPVWCGEFGVYSKEADPADRVEWYRTVRQMLETRGIPWTTWDYRGSFGLFDPGSSEAFPRDVNLPLVQALGFTLPPAPGPAPSGFWLVHDQGDEEPHGPLWLPGGAVDFFDLRNPASGRFSLSLKRLQRYGSVSWSFAPVRDLSSLAQTARLTFQARSNQAKFSFELRFVDGPSTKTDGLPWRKAFVVTEAAFLGDGRWHKVSVPFSTMTDGGAWDGSWHEPRPGAFQWSRTGEFQIVAEEGDFGDLEVGIDDLGVGVANDPNQMGRGGEDF